MTEKKLLERILEELEKLNGNIDFYIRSEMEK